MRNSTARFRSECLKTESAQLLQIWSSPSFMMISSISVSLSVHVFFRPKLDAKSIRSLTFIEGQRRRISEALTSNPGSTMNRETEQWDFDPHRNEYDHSVLFSNSQFSPNSFFAKSSMSESMSLMLGTVA